MDTSQHQGYYAQYEGKSVAELLQQLAVAFGGGSGSAQFHFLQNLVYVRIAEMVSKQLAETSASISASANRIKDAVEHAEQTGKGTIENSSEWLINAIAVETKSGVESAKEITSQISLLTSALSAATRELKEAGNQSSRAASKLNSFTATLAVGTLLLCGAGCWQAWETHRQVDLSREQFQFSQQQAVLKNQPSSDNKKK